MWHLEKGRVCVQVSFVVIGVGEGRDFCIADKGVKMRGMVGAVVRLVVGVRVRVCSG